ncbi:hypothetical protein LCGC14_2732800 [marine sediment metagenome]|uniref:Uncharacterized protein n=1 Tax=marine sediment metagenome TaxID=412755 RepID=A0A0F8Z6V6_9ZZZZ
MPYIEKQRKAELKPLLDKINLAGSGELTYAVSILMMNFLKRTSPHLLTFSILNSCIGAVERATDEFKRRILDPYEQQKIRDNGDIYQEFIRDSNINTLFK